MSGKKLGCFGPGDKVMKCHSARHYLDFLFSVGLPRQLSVVQPAFHWPLYRPCYQLSHLLSTTPPLMGARGSLYKGGLDHGPDHFSGRTQLDFTPSCWPPLILKIVLKNSLSHKHSNDLFYFNIAPSIIKLESILCATRPRRINS